MEYHSGAMRWHGVENVALVGIGCKFPGKIDAPERFWAALLNREDLVTEVPRERWDVDAHFSADVGAAGRIATRRGGFVADIEGFDPAFFHLAPREAREMDPQQR